MDNLVNIENFLFKYNQHPAILDIDEAVKNMLKEMELGLKGQESSLLMIPSYLTDEGDIPFGPKAIAIDAGGTNLRIATVSFSEEGILVENLHKQKMLGVDKPLTKDEFINALCTLIEPYLDSSNKIGFIFSFAFDSTPDKDGKVISLSKEVHIDLKDALLGEEIKKCLKAKGVTKDVAVIVLNDTVSTLLGGPTVKPTQPFDGQIGLILGTGTNTAYTEATRKIEKIDCGYDGKMIINMESGNFNKYPLGEFDLRVDKASANPTCHLLEKCISGVYLGNIICETVKQAALEGLFSKESTVANLPPFSMSQVDKFLREPYGDNLLANACATAQDTYTMGVFVDKALDRAAKLVTVNLASCVVQMDAGKDISKPCRIVVEGSTFHKCLGYRQKIEYFMKQYLNDKLNRYYYFTSGDDVNLTGAAQAALLNG